MTASADHRRSESAVKLGAWTSMLRASLREVPPPLTAHEAVRQVELQRDMLLRQLSDALVTISELADRHALRDLAQKSATERYAKRARREVETATAALTAQVEELQAKIASLGRESEATRRAHGVEVAQLDARVEALRVALAESIDGAKREKEDANRREGAANVRASKAERELNGLRDQRAELNAKVRELRSSSPEQAAVEAKLRAALAAAEERVTAAAALTAEAQARATKAIRAADDRAERARKSARDGVAAAEVAATEAAERKARAAEAKLRKELDSTRAEAAKLEAGRAMLEREVAGARAEVAQHRRRPIPAAPREPLLTVLSSGARSVTAHRARLAGWAAGEGADVEAARALAVVVRDDAAPPEARMRAQTALAGLLGGVR
jgi:hypothetical protein